MRSHQNKGFVEYLLSHKLTWRQIFHCLRLFFKTLSLCGSDINKLLRRLCSLIAGVVKLQSGREYFALSPDFKEILPTHKLSSERNWNYFDSLPRALEIQNIKFSASNLRSNLNLVSLNQPHRVQIICNEAVGLMVRSVHQPRGPMKNWVHGSLAISMGPNNLI